MPASDPDLTELIADLQRICGPRLSSIVLYGSAAGATTRAVSDRNLLVVLDAADDALLAAVGEAIAVRRIALRLRLMVITAAEIPSCLRLLTVRMADILRRRTVLHGGDPFAGLEIPRDAAIHQLRQSLLDLALRLREARACSWDPVRTAAECSGGLRACAAVLAQLDGLPAANARSALQHYAGDPLAELSLARDMALDADAGWRLIVRLAATVQTMRAKADALP